MHQYNRKINCNIIMSQTLIKISGLFFFAFLFFYGLYISIASLKNSERFIRGYKRIDLIKISGDSGRIVYFIFGILISVIATLMFLKFLHIGPWAGSNKSQ